MLVRAKQGIHRHNYGSHRPHMQTNHALNATASTHEWVNGHFNRQLQKISADRPRERSTDKEVSSSRNGDIAAAATVTDLRTEPAGGRRPVVGALGRLHGLSRLARVDRA